MKQKRLLSLLLAAGLCVSLAACGGTDDTADDPVTEPDQEPTGYTAEELAAQEEERKKAEEQADLPGTVADLMQQLTDLQLAVCELYEGGGV